MTHATILAYLIRSMSALRKFREQHHLSQVTLARLLGVSSVTVSRWETGARRIDEDLVRKISLQTGIPTADLRPDLAALLSVREAAE